MNVLGRLQIMSERRTTYLSCPLPIMVHSHHLLISTSIVCLTGMFKKKSSSVRFQIFTYFSPLLLFPSQNRFHLPHSNPGWLGSQTPDLNTESPHVISTLNTWIHHLVSTFQIDALRIDTVKHVRKEFWKGFMESAGVACLGEVLNGDPTYLARYQREVMGSIFDFATYWHIQ